jgi:ABC-type nitrate/sulfonate/bicarbonate transport system substrate-binding protein
MRRRTLKSVAAGLVALAAFGTGHAHAQSQRIRIFAGSSPVFAPVFIADQRGFFKAEGIDVQVRPFSSGAEATEGFRSGAADFLVASDVPLIYLLVGGDTVMLAQFSANRDMLVMVGPKGTAGPADLKGKKIGLVTRSSSEYLLHQYLKRAGLGLGDIERVHLAPFDQVPAIARGDVQALSSWKPFDLKIGQVTGDRQQVLSNNGQESYVLYSGIVAKRDFAARNPGDTEKVLRALAAASRWLTEASLTARSEALGAYLKTDPKDVQHVISNNGWDMTVSPAFVATLTDIEDFLAKQNLIKSRVNWGTALDWNPLRKIDPRLVP